jgi:hypothetical protein
MEDVVAGRLREWPGPRAGGPLGQPAGRLHGVLAGAAGVLRRGGEALPAVAGRPKDVGPGGEAAGVLLGSDRLAAPAAVPPLHQEQLLQERRPVLRLHRHEVVLQARPGAFAPEPVEEQVHAVGGAGWLRAGRVVQGSGHEGASAPWGRGGSGRPGRLPGASGHRTCPFTTWSSNPRMLSEPGRPLCGLVGEAGRRVVIPRSAAGGIHLGASAAAAPRRCRRSAPAASPARKWGTSPCASAAWGFCLGTPRSSGGRCGSRKSRCVEVRPFTPSALRSLVPLPGQPSRRGRPRPVPGKGQPPGKLPSGWSISVWAAARASWAWPASRSSCSDAALATPPSGLAAAASTASVELRTPPTWRPS